MGATRVRRWSRQEYEKMIESRIFPPGTRAELIEGEILSMAPQQSPHAVAISLIEDGLRMAFGPGFTIRPQLPLAVDAYSEPEPDIAVVPGSPRDFLTGHPASAVLVVEISDTSLAFDRHEKAGLYARAGIADYWIINLIDRKVEIYRNPVAAPSSPSGWTYGRTQSYTSGQHVTPLAAPNASIPVTELLP